MPLELQIHYKYKYKYNVCEQVLQLTACSARKCASSVLVSLQRSESLHYCASVSASAGVLGYRGGRQAQVVINAFLHFDSKQICAFFAQLKIPTLHTTALFSLQIIPLRKMQSHLEKFSEQALSITKRAQQSLSKYFKGTT